MSIKVRMSVRTESEPEIKPDLFSIIDDDFGQISFSKKTFFSLNNKSLFKSKPYSVLCSIMRGEE